MKKFRGQQKWQSDAPARTNSGFSIRKETISAPIPQVDDDEFPIRTPGTGIATPLGRESHERQPRTKESPVEDEDFKPQEDAIAVSDSGDTIRTKQSIPLPAPQPAHQPVSQQPESQNSQHPNHASTLRTSMGSVPSAANVEKPQRKKSSFRTVLGRIFGKKKRSSASTNPQGLDSIDLRAGQHRSHPTVLNRNPLTKTGSQQRSTSLPINEFNRALRSHSVIVNDDFPLHNTTKQANRDSIQADGHTRPRRATTPSRLWTPNKTPGYVDWKGLSPRPASIQVRGSMVISDEEAEAVGIAVTSGSHPNRRSRSLGELRGAVPLHAVTRRRSDEIKYWRESFDQGLLSPISSNKPDEDPIQIDEPENTRKPHEQPQPFNFGPLGEMAGMKITQVASLETRVMQLQERMHKLERVVSRIQYNTGSEPIQFQDPPHRSSRGDRSVSTSRPGTERSEVTLPKHRQPNETRSHGNHQNRSSSYGSSRPSTTSTSNSYHPSFDDFPRQTSQYPETALNSSQKVARPLSTSTTIRGIPSSSPTTSKDGNLTAEHYTILTNMILAEQAARKTLENTVDNLQQELQVLHSCLQRGNSQFKKPPARKEFSSFEKDDSSDDEGRYNNEDFQTPNEEGGHFGDEIFGDISNDHGEVKSAPRTLSLSQITLGNNRIV